MFGCSKELDVDRLAGCTVRLVSRYWLTGCAWCHQNYATEPYLSPYPLPTDLRQQWRQEWHDTQHVPTVPRNRPVCAGRAHAARRLPAGLIVPPLRGCRPSLCTLRKVWRGRAHSREQAHLAQGSCRYCVHADVHCVAGFATAVPSKWPLGRSRCQLRRQHLS